ncbi:acetate--CoA ligase [Faecalibacter rhinopitheci]|uniref:Acetate--CoA ligase n=1 Tax=Faecalibacter rhinopitheci TaxID=2779678 RepID=A0A8J7FNS6_9FLAO|nr:acetate--CoA ligase [Faecalibacter rhinopitheci]MBF0596504.1 acetate--CoA ligase [Faecalibacter rhinopitheci]MBQ0147606.1 acetate--CoA ligase [Candidatus Onthonaster equi]
MNNLRINSFSEYKKAYKESIENPEMFWDNIAENFLWKKKWNNTLEFDFSKSEFKWFKEGKLNITENVLDRHLEKNGNKTAIIWEPNNPLEETRIITYRQLHAKVCQFANVLKNNGIQKGDRVCIYMPMIPELAIAMLACARIGAVHSIVFAGFSSAAIASRINDAQCKLIVTANEVYRGEKPINLKHIVDEALKDCPSIQTCIVYRRELEPTMMVGGRDKFWIDEMAKASKDCLAEEMDAEDPLFILYTSGSTGKPKGMVHTTAGYMIQTAYSFDNVFQMQPEDIYWCTADIGWITGHSYIIYGPLACGATTVMFEGIPSYPDFGRFWEIVEKLKVTHFYTAPTAIRSLAKESLDYVLKYDLSSLKVLGSVGEPINQEAWHWYNDYVGKGNCPIVDTWWQTETGSIMISPLAGITSTRPTFATLPLPGIQLALMDENGQEIVTSAEKSEGRLTIKFPWPSMARTVYGDHQRYIETYFSTFKNAYFTGDGAYRDAMGYYRITGRVDDVVIVSGHNLGTAPIENAINEHDAVVESAVVGFPHDIKGNALYAFVILYDDQNPSEQLIKEIKDEVSKSIGAIAKPDKIQFVKGLPKTRSGKIMRRILRKIASNETDFGDTSTLLNPEIVQDIEKGKL